MLGCAGAQGATEPWGMSVVNDLRLTVDSDIVIASNCPGLVAVIQT